MSARPNESVIVGRDVFARLVGEYAGRDMMLFEVSRHFFERVDSSEWSDPVLFRLVRREGAKVELEFHKIDLAAIAPQEDSQTTSQSEGV